MLVLGAHGAVRPAEAEPDTCGFRGADRLQGGYCRRFGAHGAVRPARAEPDVAEGAARRVVEQQPPCRFMGNHSQLGHELVD